MQGSFSLLTILEKMVVIYGKKNQWVGRGEGQIRVLLRFKFSQKSLKGSSSPCNFLPFISPGHHYVGGGGEVKNYKVHHHHESVYQTSISVASLYFVKSEQKYLKSLGANYNFFAVFLDKILFGY